MPDAFEALRAEYRLAPYPPTDPDPGFAARLRARLEQALTLPEGVDVTVTTLETEFVPEAAASDAAPAPRMAITPYLAVAGAARALDWYADAFGARRRMEPIVMPDGRIGHAELDFGGALIMLADEFPEIGHTAPRPGAGSGVTLHLEVVDVDAVVGRAVERGAVLDRPVADAEYGRNAVLVDPFGHRWQVMAAPKPESATTEPARYPGGTRHGDVGYMSLQVPDLGRAQAFYGAVLGWEFAPAERDRAVRVIDAAPTTGVSGGHERGDAVLCWRVDDVAVAVERVRRAGGTATEPETRPYGTASDCVDDQGMAFYLWQPTEADAAATADVATADRPVNGTRHGDVAYLTIGVVDSARFRTFFGSVLGWRFTPGQAVDGWNIEGTMPMAGLHGGQDRAGVEPMYRVDDIDAAVESVRRAGGTPGEVERHPYGITSRCLDNQGIPFYLVSCDVDQGRYEVVPIGVVESPLTDPAAAPKQGDEGSPDAWMVFDPAVLEGLRDLQPGEEVIVLTWLHQADRDVLSVHPRDDVRNPERGVFSTRSASRPNPIGLHQVEIVAIDGSRAQVRNLEAIDGTPVLDVKPVLGANRPSLSNPG